MSIQNDSAVPWGQSLSDSPGLVVEVHIFILFQFYYSLAMLCIYQLTPYNIPEDLYLYQHCCENLKSWRLNVFSVCRYLHHLDANVFIAPFWADEISLLLLVFCKCGNHFYLLWYRLLWHQVASFSCYVVNPWHFSVYHGYKWLLVCSAF